jgi:hypothetical protein
MSRYILPSRKNRANVGRWPIQEKAVAIQQANILGEMATASSIFELLEFSEISESGALMSVAGPNCELPTRWDPVPLTSEAAIDAYLVFGLARGRANTAVLANNHRT